MENSRKLAAERVWQRQSVWSRAADRAKRKISRTRTVGLSLGITAAVLATSAAQAMTWSPVASRVLAFLSAAAGLAPLVATRSGPSAVRDWTRRAEHFGGGSARRGEPWSLWRVADWPPASLLRSAVSGPRPPH